MAKGRDWIILTGVLVALLTVSFLSGRFSAMGLIKAESVPVSSGSAGMQSSLSEELHKAPTNIHNTLEFEGTLSIPPNEVAMFSVDKMYSVNGNKSDQACKIIDFGEARLYVNDIPDEELPEGEYLTYYEESFSYILLYYQKVDNNDIFGVIVTPISFTDNELGGIDALAQADTQV